MSEFAHLMPNVVHLGWLGQNGWLTSIGQTLYMTFWGSPCLAVLLV